MHDVEKLIRKAKRNLNFEGWKQNKVNEIKSTFNKRKLNNKLKKMQKVWHNDINPSSEATSKNVKAKDNE